MRPMMGQPKVSAGLFMAMGIGAPLLDFGKGLVKLGQVSHRFLSASKPSLLSAQITN